jgi:hypothetical protein
MCSQEENSYRSPQAPSNAALTSTREAPPIEFSGWSKLALVCLGVNFSMFVCMLLISLLDTDTLVYLVVSTWAGSMFLGLASSIGAFFCRGSANRVVGISTFLWFAFFFLVWLAGCFCGALSRH